MKIKVVVIFVVFMFVKCKKQPKELIKYVDEYVIKDSIQFKNTLIGGLSGIDYKNGVYYMVIDDEKMPRVITAKINIDKDTISKVDFLNVIHLNNSNPFFNQNILDLESVFIDKNNHMNMVSEGAIREGANPTIFSVNNQGDFIESYNIPEYFKANSSSKPRHNAVFEASCKSFNEEGFWVGMEGVLEADGNEPSQLKETPPARITYFNYKTKEATLQFAYPLDYIKRPSKGGFNVNGITSILEYSKNEFFVIERSYQSGYGIEGNVVKIYKVLLNEKVTNTLNIKSLKEKTFIPVEKELVFDFNTIRNKLTDGIVDNIEGITLGPKLSNGNQSLIVIADDNFQKHGRQLNQFILLEINQKQ